MKPYVLGPGEGETYVFHGVTFAFKASNDETRGALAMWEATSGRARRPIRTHTHTHEDEMFCVVSGAMTLICGDDSIKAPPGTFVFARGPDPHLPHRLPPKFTSSASARHFPSATTSGRWAKGSGRAIRGLGYLECPRPRHECRGMV